MRVAVIGGTGKLGMGLATRLARASHDVVIGSRDAGRAGEAARAAGGTIEGASNSDAVARCDVAVLCIPYEGRVALLEPLKEHLRDRIVIDTTVPLDPADLLQLRTASGASAAEETSALVNHASVFAAFQTLSHRVLKEAGLSHDVLVAGPGDRKPQVLELIRSMGLHPVDAGPLRAARLLENMTVLLISINRQNKVKESGIKITGLPA